MFITINIDNKYFLSMTINDRRIHGRRRIIHCRDQVNRTFDFLEQNYIRAN